MAIAALPNWWTEAKCAKAFWGQHELPPYQRLLTDTLDWADPQAGESWLDLGCGGGALSKGIWERTGGAVGSVLGIDCAAANAESYRSLQRKLIPPPGPRVDFECHNFSKGLSLFSDDTFDGVVSGLSISYAESLDDATATWTTAAYDHLLCEVFRVLTPGGRFVFSVNVPEPSWAKVGLLSLGGIFRAHRPLQFLKKSYRMLLYGQWLKREARTGRFHYLPAATVESKLREAGFTTVEHHLSYAGQAFIFRAGKPS